MRGSGRRERGPRCFSLDWEAPPWLGRRCWVVAVKSTPTPQRWAGNTEERKHSAQEGGGTSTACGSSRLRENSSLRHRPAGRVSCPLLSMLTSPSVRLSLRQLCVEFPPPHPCSGRRRDSAKQEATLLGQSHRAAEGSPREEQARRPSSEARWG